VVGEVEAGVEEEAVAGLVEEVLVKGKVIGDLTG
jgi:hypothetical protein